MSQVTQQSVLACKSNGALQDEVVLDVLPASKSKGVKTSRSWSSNGIQTIAGQSTMKRAKKRRKVNHACLYCRRSHMTCDQQRPCTRCIKRNIGHLCHDEPREYIKKIDSGSTIEGNETPSTHETPDGSCTATEQLLPHVEPDLDIELRTLSHAAPSDLLQIAQPSPISVPQSQDFNGNTQQFLGYNEWDTGGSQFPYQDMHTFHPNYMFNTSEVTNEYNLLNDFLSTSLLDEAYYQGEDPQGIFSDPSILNAMGSLHTPNPLYATGLQPTQSTLPSQSALGNATSRPASGFPLDKAQERYYMTAADPAGTDNPEERMNKLLRAKYDAGMLKPFNYVNGYARLNQYMEHHLQPNSRQRILRQLDQFRPGFRERMRKLTDMELVKVEMWFETCLMEYDRVFASMAIPACCWRRTGEIFRGNREMAELIKVPLESLRDGKLAIHEIIGEDSLVSYWEKFGSIAFETSRKAILTSCSLKSPDLKAGREELKCCFSFTVKRDTHNIPSLIVGNFLPIKDRRS